MYIIILNKVIKVIKMYIQHVVSYYYMLQTWKDILRDSLNILIGSFNMLNSINITHGSHDIGTVSAMNEK